MRQHLGHLVFSGGLVGSHLGDPEFGDLVQLLEFLVSLDGRLETALGFVDIPCVAVPMEGESLEFAALARIEELSHVVKTDVLGGKVVRRGWRDKAGVHVAHVCTP